MNRHFKISLGFFLFINTSKIPNLELYVIINMLYVGKLILAS